MEEYLENIKTDLRFFDYLRNCFLTNAHESMTNNSLVTYAVKIRDEAGELIYIIEKLINLVKELTNEQTPKKIND